MATVSSPTVPTVYDEHDDLVYAGAIIRQARKKQGRSLEEVASIARVPKTNLADFETGAGDLLTRRLYRVLHTLGLSPNDLARPKAPSVYTRIMLLVYAFGPEVADRLEGLLKVFAALHARRRA